MVAPASETGVSDTREAVAAASVFLHCPRHINFNRKGPVQYAKGSVAARGYHSGQ